jgi:hypothetical protein
MSFTPPQYLFTSHDHDAIVKMSFTQPPYLFTSREHDGRSGGVIQPIAIFVYITEGDVTSGCPSDCPSTDPRSLRHYTLYHEIVHGHRWIQARILLSHAFMLRGLKK